MNMHLGQTVLYNNFKWQDYILFYLYPKDWRREEKGMTEKEMIGWHHWLNGHEFEYTLGIGDGQGGLACCSPWGGKESDMTEWLNWTDNLFLNFPLLKCGMSFSVLWYENLN